MRTIERFVEWLFAPGELLPQSRSAALRAMLAKAEEEERSGQRKQRPSYTDANAC